MPAQPATDGSGALFDRFAADYDRFFSERPDVFESEMRAIVSLGLEGLGLDIGVGTGILSRQLGKVVGIDVAREMLEQAQGRGIECLQASAYRLPFRSGAFDFALMSTTLCFLRDPDGALREANRVLRPGGSLAVCVIVRGSPWGRFYAEKARHGHPIYSHARFFDVDEIKGMLCRTGFHLERTASTLCRGPEEPPAGIELVREDDLGSYVCIRAKKERSRIPGLGRP